MAEMNKDTATLLQEMIDVKKDIRTSINNKGVDVVGGMVTYPDAIDRISGIMGVDSDIDYTQIGWTLNNSNEQNEIDAQYINKGLEYAKTLMDECDASKWGEWYEDNAITGNKNLIYSPFIYNLDKHDFGTTFADCVRLRSIPLIDTSKLTSMRGMFRNCHSLTSIPAINTSNVTNMYQMFYDCSSLTTIPLLDTSNVTDMGGMFHGCHSLTSVPQMDTSNVGDMGHMFYGCESIETISINVDNATDLSYMFCDCDNLKTVEFIGSSNYTSTDHMFHGCLELETVSRLYMGGVESTTSMFRDCGSLKNLGKLDYLMVDLDLSYCPNLTKESLMNVINGLSNVRSTTKLTIGSVNLAKLTSEDVKIATDKVMPYNHLQ